MSRNSKNKKLQQEAEREMKAYRHWLHRMQTIGPKTLTRLLEIADAKSLYTIPRAEVEGILNARQLDEFLTSRTRTDVLAAYAKVEAAGMKFVTREDAEYPARLRQLPDAPYGLYYYGRLPDDATPTVAIIGARICSEYGRFMARQFGTELGAAGVQVVSGMALGVDGIAQKGALSAGGASYGVLGSSVDVCYPEENRALYDDLIASGGVISEYAPSTAPEARFFPQRNRIIAGLADIVLVIEARKKSGTLITVDLALEYGRDVFAVPGRVTDRLSDGCNFLIRQGAGIAFSPGDVLEAIYGAGRIHGDPSGRVQTQAQGGSSETPDAGERDRRLTLSPIEDALIRIVDIEPLSVNAVHERLSDQGLSVTVPTLMNTLVTMCLKGLMQQEGGYFCKRLG